MKFIYIGCEGAPEVSIHFGVEFTIGYPAEVTDQTVIAKLQRHPHFCEDNCVEPESAIEQKDEKGELIAVLAARGIKADRRSSVDRLRTLVEGE